MYPNSDKSRYTVPGPGRPSASSHGKTSHALPRASSEGNDNFVKTEKNIQLGDLGSGIYIVIINNPSGHFFVTDRQRYTPSFHVYIYHHHHHNNNHQNAENNDNHWGGVSSACWGTNGLSVEVPPLNEHSATLNTTTHCNTVQF